MADSVLDAFNHMQAYPNETSAHFARATEGLIFGSKQGAQLLYRSRDCLGLTGCDFDDPATVHAAGNNSQYEVVHHGLDMAMTVSKGVCQKHTWCPTEVGWADVFWPFRPPPP
jgi:hypothetical protein